MTAQRSSYLGLFAHLLNIRPWETDRLTLNEFLDLVDWCDDYNKGADK